MAKDKQDWDDALEGDAIPTGMNEDMVRRALQMNPALRSMGNTSEVMEHLLQGAKAGVAKASPTAAKPEAPASGDLLVLLAAAADKHQNEKTRLAAEIAKLQGEQKALTSGSLDTVINAILATDPSMLSPRTGEILSRHKAFLSEIGFSVKKVVDRQEQAQKPKGK